MKVMVGQGLISKQCRQYQLTFHLQHQNQMSETVRLNRARETEHLMLSHLGRTLTRRGLDHWIAQMSDSLTTDEQTDQLIPNVTPSRSGSKPLRITDPTEGTAPQNVGILIGPLGIRASHENTMMIVQCALQPEMRALCHHQHTMQGMLEITAMFVTVTVTVTRREECRHHNHLLKVGVGCTQILLQPPATQARIDVTSHHALIKAQIGLIVPLHVQWSDHLQTSHLQLSIVPQSIPNAPLL
jgi:hypothetical protein